MRAKFWVFNKRVNSTKIPTEQGIEIEFLYYKDVIDISNPIIDVSNNAINSDYNYVQIGSKYFFVDSVDRVTLNIIRFNLHIDLLATYKNEILNTTAYVTRAAGMFNQYIVDDFNTPTAQVNKIVLQENYSDFYETGDGCYILEVINSLTGVVNSGFNAAYILTAEQMQEIASALMTDNGVIDELKKIFSAPIDSIVSCKWLPLNYNSVAVQTGALTTNVYLGSYDTEISAYLVGLNLIEHSCEFDLSPYIQNSYLRNSKYTDILLCLPYVGTVSIDTRQILESADNSESRILRVRVCVDVRSGKQLTIITESGHPNAPINTFETAIYEDRPISSSASNIAPTLYSVAAAIPMAGMGGGWLAGSLSSVNTSIVESFRTNYSSVGTSGGSAFEGFGTAARCVILERGKSYLPNDSEIRNTIGLPLNKSVLISSLGGGFVQTINASVDANCYYSELLEINNMLNGGVYIE